MTHVVDTHALVFYLTEIERLGKRALAALRDPDARLIIPTIVLSEIKYLAHKRRIPTSFEKVVSELQADDSSR